MSRRFSGKVVLVAGGAGGIGQAICRLFFAEGASVACADVSEKRGRPVCSEIDPTGAHVAFVSLDAGSVDSWTSAIEETIRRFGGIDCLVTAVYSGGAGSIETMTLAEWEKSFRVTCTGVFLGMHVAAPVIRPGGAVVNVASIAAHAGAEKNIAYGAAKAAVIAATKSAALHLAARNVRANVVTPGLIDTFALRQTLKVITHQPAEIDTLLEERSTPIALRRIGKPVEVANAILFLCSDEASYVTGTEIIVDGGLMARTTG